MTTDRRYGVNGNTAIKNPCRVCSTSNITLSGEQTIDGVAVVDGDRVLVTGQTSGANNGIYECDTGTWSRTKDWDGSYDIETGTLIYVTAGTSNSGWYYVATTGTITIGTTSVTISQAGTQLALVSAFIQTLLNDADAATARTTLGAVGLTGDETVAGIKAFTGNNTHAGYELFSVPTGYTPGWGASHTNNLSLTASVGSSALTIALKTRAGADATSTTPIEIAFGSATAATGDYTVRQVTAANSLVISSGSTLGTTSGQISRIWVVAFDDAGTIRLGVINCYDGLNVYPLADDIIASSTAEGGAGAADSAGVFYTGTAVTSKPYRVLGYVESTQATAGTWATTPSKTRGWTQGMKLPNDVIQTRGYVDTASATGTTTTPLDDSIPQQSTDGTQYMSQDLTPTSPANVLKIEHEGWYAVSVAGTMSCAIHQDSTEDAIAVAVTAFPSTADMRKIHATHFMKAATTSATTFKIKTGNSAAGTVTFNGRSGGRQYGGAIKSNIVITEIMA